MKFPKFPLKIIILLSFLFLTNILVLFGTWMFHFYYYNIMHGQWQEGSTVKYLLLEFSLGSENTLATWYSSMLFLLVAFMSLICFLVQRNREEKKRKNISLGWVMFILIFTLLSFDELASMHERLGSLAALNPLGDYPPGWIYLLGVPIAVVGIMMLLFCRRMVQQAPWAAGFAAAGILLFLSIPLQEYFEMQAWESTSYSKTWMRPVQFLILEEGSEIMGVLLILLCTLTYIYRVSPGGASKTLLNFNNLINKKKFLSIVLIILILMVLPMVVLDQSPIFAGDAEMGVMRNWFPAATSFLAFLCCIFIYLYQSSESSPSRRNNYIILALFCLLFSAYYGSDMYYYSYIFPEQRFKILFYAIIFPAVILLGYRRFVFNENTSGRRRIIIWGTLIIIALVVNYNYSAFIAYAAFSLLIYSLSVRLFSPDKVANEAAGIQVL